MKKEPMMVYEDGKVYELDSLGFENWGVDAERIIKSYNGWKFLCEQADYFERRRPNFPEFISEIVFCMVTGCRTVVGAPGGFKTSFDCYNFKKNKRIELKATSIKSDLTSFSPTFNFDDFYFMDFYRDGSFDGKFDIYAIKKDLLLNTFVNKAETVKDQQGQGRRPRFGVMEKIIIPNKYTPILTGNIYGGTMLSPKVTVIKHKRKVVLTSKPIVKNNVESKQLNCPILA